MANKDVPSHDRVPISASIADEEWRALTEMFSISERELEVLECLLNGMHQRAVAHRLRISQHTVRTYTARLYGKLGVRTELEAVRRVMLALLNVARASATGGACASPRRDGHAHGDMPTWNR